MGRTLKLTAERQQSIVAKITDGVWLATAALASGVSEPTFWRWMQLGEIRKNPVSGKEIYPPKIYRDFREAVTRARAEAEASAVKDIRTQSKAGDPRATMFYLERSFRDRWGRVEKIVTETTPVDAQPTFDPALLSADELSQLEGLLTKGKPEPPLPGR